MWMPLPISTSAGPSWITRCRPRTSPAPCLGHRVPASRGMTPEARGQLAAGRSSSCSSLAPRPPRAGCTLTTMAYTTRVRRWVA
ncbi:hypothetical protein Celaphus_00007725 [Cervus elaphus hippelaphus]|uniref:Uncharacterized protein n=1 Tax=Cervus elaphus hippelaphus TaxID=46360 RepID=A0A212CBM7_CEREH|nr:hypothetical protein Celaphus_00007725 [Cervus elaphus hippelaphus]